MPGTIVVTAIVLVAAVLALRPMVRHMKGQGGCCGGDSCSSSAPAAGPSSVGVQDTDPAHYPYHTQLSVEGMSCNACKTRVENALNTQEGIWARVDLKTGTADILSKDRSDDNALARVVEAAGYRAFTQEQAKSRRSQGQLH